jgi:hypothetical protein
LSRDENAVGVTQFDTNGHLPFPTLIPLDGKPLVMAVGALKPGAKPTLAIIVDKDGVRSLVTRTADGKTKTQKLSDSFKSNPTTLAIQDVNQDGLADLVVLIPYEKIKVLLQNLPAILTRRTLTRRAARWNSRGSPSADVDGDGKTGFAPAAEKFCARGRARTAGQNAGFDQSAGLGFPRERPDQRRGQRFAHHRRDGDCRTAPTPCLRFSCSTRSTSS